MILLNHTYSDIRSLTLFIERHRLYEAGGLIQLFCGTLNRERLTPVLSLLAKLDGFKVIGSSTAGGISNGSIEDDVLLISFSSFERTRVDVRYLPYITQEQGRLLGEELHGSDAKLLIAYGNALNDNPEPFLEGIGEAAPELLITGGNAADNQRYQETFVVCDNRIHDRGMVIALLRGNSLQVTPRQLLNWTPIGMEMEVNHSVGNKIYALDGRPVLETYRHYLGDEVAAALPGSVTVFPLISRESGVDIARTPVRLDDDGGLVFAGEFRFSQTVRFAVAIADQILRSAHNTARELSCDAPLEALYIYTCHSRRQLSEESSRAEMEILSHAAPSIGFVTQGEYFHAPGMNRLQNSTTTLVAISESDETVLPSSPLREPPPREISTLRSLTHLANTTADELRQSMKQLEQYKSALDKTAIVSKTDSSGKITYINNLFEQISGYSREDVLGKTHAVLRHPDMPDSLFEDLWRTIRAKQVWTGVIKNRKKCGGSYYVQSTLVPILDEHGEINEYISIRNDITQVMENKALVAQQRTDKLTGLPSRTKLLEDIENDHSELLALTDLRNFKSINDYYGIDHGDRLIAEIAEQFTQILGRNEIRCYRLYGASFAFLPPSGMRQEAFEAQLLAARTDIQSHRFNANGEEIDIELSFGMARGNNHLLALAETAIQKAKQEKAREQIITISDHEQEHLNRLFWINEVKDALAEDRITAYFQPIVSSVDASDIRYEALLRMIDTNGTPVSPFHFLDTIKQTRHYAAITRRMLDIVLSTARRHQLRISVNLSAEDIENQATRSYILERLAKYEGPPIALEITESESLSDFAEVRDFIRQVRRYDTRIAIDDFGSGYSNFSYLVELQPDFIKIDGSIISGILEDEKSMVVTQSIIDLAHKTGAKVVAEFVSSDELAESLRWLGVDYLQGFALGKPAPLS
ncbi:bifunctional diguanylate cyclase/phosphodiesterase [Marinobacterium lutimaris]|uniref:PAS domain S-box-containing protein/diguanylate cyclase (GGDEF) domain-containing protein n=1 Tax=Marinobacterium lutimaris TaxID=568106 RepID=A0A1H6DAG3_9GAMM|nr:EAL domain-containing protein [Marinobacterium lutimaris]SEG82218.1 PAS domain S-box-containing protein/diguanylate cyclase (GGDEF) domain-containing protein [Marinobacterium lutimaris]